MPVPRKRYTSGKRKSAASNGSNLANNISVIASSIAAVSAVVALIISYYQVGQVREQMRLSRDQFAEQIKISQDQFKKQLDKNEALWKDEKSTLKDQFQEQLETNSSQFKQEMQLTRDLFEDEKELLTRQLDQIDEQIRQSQDQFEESSNLTREALTNERQLKIYKKAVLSSLLGDTAYLSELHLAAKELSYRPSPPDYKNSYFFLQFKEIDSIPIVSAIDHIRLLQSFDHGSDPFQDYKHTLEFIERRRNIRATFNDVKRVWEAVDYSWDVNKVVNSWGLGGSFDHHIDEKPISNFLYQCINSKTYKNLKSNAIRSSDKNFLDDPEYITFRVDELVASLKRHNTKFRNETQRNINLREIHFWTKWELTNWAFYDLDNEFEKLKRDRRILEQLLKQSIPSPALNTP